MRPLLLALLTLLAPIALAQDILEVAEVMPEPEGGLEAFQASLAYPAEARADSAEGRVIVAFVVDAEGRAQDATILRGVHPLLDQAVLDTLEETAFTPGRQDGEAVAVRLVMPVWFRLDDDGTYESGAQAAAPVAVPAPVEGIATAVEEMPEIIGGLSALAEQIVYPSEAEKEGVEGQVLVSLIVDEQGSVAQTEVIRSAHPLLDDAALAAVRGVTFRPGRQDGLPVKVRLVLPITFQLADRGRG